MTPEAARAFLVSHHALAVPAFPVGHAGVRAVLERLRCIQVDPLDPMGTNADLVAMARVDGLGKGDVYRALLPSHAFEHFAKERCLLPASAFPYYRAQAHETPWWRHSERMTKLSPELIAAVRDEIAERGPLAAGALTDRGRIEPMDWAGWKGTSKAATLALEVLWTRCEVVVSDRTGKDKRYDLPERALPDVVAAEATEDFATWALLERVEAAGLLAETSGPWWSMLASVRTSGLATRLVAEGRLERVALTGLKRSFLVPAGFRDRPVAAPDDRMRLLGPLDPLIWNRELVRHVFGFDYVWEVYKPAAQRKFGWYVCPLLHRGRLVGRLEARLEQNVLRVLKVWPEDGMTLDPEALRACLERHATALGAEAVSGLE